MKFKEFKGLLETLYQKSTLLADLEQKSDKTIYEQQACDRLKKIIKNYDDILFDMTGELRLENFLKVKLSILEKHLLPSIENTDLVYEIIYKSAKENFVDYKPFADVRLKKPSTDGFGDLYYHMEYVKNAVEPIDKENTYIVLRPLINLELWNGLCTEHRYRYIILSLWHALREQLIESGKISKIESYVLKLSKDENKTKESQN